GEAATAAPTPDRGGQAEPLPHPMSRAGVGATVVVPPPAAAAVSAAQAPPEPPLVSDRAAFALRPRQSPVTGIAPAVALRPAAPTQDNLQRIGSITPEIEHRLNAQGVTRYAQIAQWSAADVERFEKQLLAGGRIARENWIEQAQILSRGGDT